MASHKPRKAERRFVAEGQKELSYKTDHLDRMNMGRLHKPGIEFGPGSSHEGFGLPVWPQPIVEEKMTRDEAWEILEMTGLRQMIERRLAGYGKVQDMMYSVDMKKENMTLRPLYKVVLGKYVILTAVAQCRRPPCRECCNPLPMV